MVEWLPWLDACHESKCVSACDDLIFALTYLFRHDFRLFS